MNQTEPRPKIERTERQSNNFSADYPSGLHCTYCHTELTRHEALEYVDEYNQHHCIDCWETD